MTSLSVTHGTCRDRNKEECCEGKYKLFHHNRVLLIRKYGCDVTVLSLTTIDEGACQFDSTFFISSHCKYNDSFLVPKGLFPTSLRKFPIVYECERLVNVPTALLLKNHIFTTNNTNEGASVRLGVRYSDKLLMLNFLYKVTLKTRVKTTNSKVGRKYASYEKVS